MDIQFFKAQNGVLNSKLTPVIRKVTNTTIKLTPLDIPLNDYLADIFDEKEEALLSKNIKISNSAQNIEVTEVKQENDYNDNYLCKS